MHIILKTQSSTENVLPQISNRDSGTTTSRINGKEPDKIQTMNLA